MRKSLILLLISVMILGLGTSAFACYGAEALGMGGAYTAVADGVLAIYWNQAGLAFSEGTYEFSGTYTIPQNDLNYNSFTGGIYNYNNKVTLGYGVTTITGGETFNTVAAGYKINDNFAIGGAVRRVNSNIILYDYYAGYYYLLEDITTGVDLSAQYRIDNLRLGVLFQDANGESENNPYIKNLRPSVAYVTDKYAVAFDLYAANNADYSDYQIGGEYYVDENWTVRSGMYQGTLTLGAGYKCNQYFSDVVYIPDWEVTQLTVGVRF